MLNAMGSIYLVYIGNILCSRRVGIFPTDMSRVYREYPVLLFGKKLSHLYGEYPERTY